MHEHPEQQVDFTVHIGPGDERIVRTHHKLHSRSDHFTDVGHQAEHQIASGADHHGQPCPSNGRDVLFSGTAQMDQRPASRSQYQFGVFPSPLAKMRGQQFSLSTQVFGESKDLIRFVILKGAEAESVGGIE